jgi:hypothetical protein
VGETIVRLRNPQQFPNSPSKSSKKDKSCCWKTINCFGIRRNFAKWIEIAKMPKVQMPRPMRLNCNEIYLNFFWNDSVALLTYHIIPTRSWRLHPVGLAVGDDNIRQESRTKTLHFLRSFRVKRLSASQEPGRLSFRRWCILIRVLSTDKTIFRRNERLALNWSD